MLDNGKIISKPVLTAFFQKIYRKINSLTSIELNSLTSGQFQRDGMVKDTPENYRSDVMNVWSTQYFDNYYIAEEDYLKYYVDGLASTEG